MKSLKFSALALLCLLCLNFNSSDKPFLIVIDAGHGGNDTGAIVNQVSEKDIVYEISQKIKALENEKFEIILMRNDDRFLSLSDRVEKINSTKPDLVLSLHIDNAKTESSSSMKAYINDNKQLKKSHYYASKLLKHLAQNEESIEFANFYILRQSTVPAVNLTLGNFYNTEDISFLSSELGQSYIAKQIIKGLQ